MALDPTWSMQSPNVKLRPGLTCSGHSCWGRRAEVADLKDQPHRGVQRDSLIACQGQHLHVADRQTDILMPPPGTGIKISGLCTKKLGRCQLNSLRPSSLEVAEQSFSLPDPEPTALS